MTNQTKSILGRKKVSELGKGYKPRTRASLLAQFGRNKLSPLAGTIVNMLTGKDFLGKELEPKKETRNLLEPMIISSVFDLIQEDPDNLFWGILAEMFGISVQTFE